jgi:hypothetical protein
MNRDRAACITDNRSTSLLINLVSFYEKNLPHSAAISKSGLQNQKLPGIIFVETSVYMFRSVLNY